MIALLLVILVLTKFTLAACVLSGDCDCLTLIILLPFIFKLPVTTLVPLVLKIIAYFGINITLIVSICCTCWVCYINHLIAFHIKTF